MVAAGANIIARVKLSELVRPPQVQCPLRGRGKDEVLAELAERVAAGVPGLGKNEIMDMLRARERQGPFSMGKGVAFPHARVDRIKEMTIGIGTCPGGVDFQSPDGHPVRLIVLFLVPRRHSNLYLHTLATFLNCFTNEKNLQRAAQARNAEEFMSLLQQIESNQQRQSSLEELIQPTPFLRVTQSVAHAIETVLANQVERIPVVDSGEELFGEVTLATLLKFATPEHKQRPLQELGDQVITKPRVVVPDTTSLSDLAALLSRENTPVAYVVRDGRLIGQINPVELLRKMIAR
jgi:PTS system nitrogen regulatory IIA component